MEAFLLGYTGAWCHRWAAQAQVQRLHAQCRHGISIKALMDAYGISKTTEDRSLKGIQGDMLASDS